MTTYGMCHEYPEIQYPSIEASQMTSDSVACGAVFRLTAGNGEHPTGGQGSGPRWPLWAASHSSALAARLCRAVPSHGPVLDRPFPVWGRFLFRSPESFGFGRTNRVRFRRDAPPTEAEGGGKREVSRGTVDVIGAGALVEGALLVAGGNGGGIVF